MFGCQSTPQLIIKAPFIFASWTVFVILKVLVVPSVVADRVIPAAATCLPMSGYKLAGIFLPRRMKA